MCCFSVIAPLGLLGRLLWPRPLAVQGTRIFARMAGGGRQALVYGLDLAAARDVAMILPLPVVPGGGEDALEFVDLSAYPDFFDDLGQWCPPRLALPKRGGPSLALPRLPVRRVGAYEASYVPTLADFARLDPRFRVPDAAWRALPAVEDYGFAVFKLRRGRRRRVHPMALRFPTRDPGRLFFPTVHVHDGEVRPTAAFEHALYYQGAGGEDMSAGPARDYLDAERCAGLVDLERPLARRSLLGELPNADTWIDLPPAGG